MLDFFIDGCHFRVFELPERVLAYRGHDLRKTGCGHYDNTIHEQITYTGCSCVCLLCILPDGLYSRINRYL
jgi:hypothetical protein